MRLLVIAVPFSILLAGCQTTQSGNGQRPAPQAATTSDTPTTASAASEDPRPSLVGRWVSLQSGSSNLLTLKNDGSYERGTPNDAGILDDRGKYEIEGDLLKLHPGGMGDLTLDYKINGDVLESQLDTPGIYGFRRLE